LSRRSLQWEIHKVESAKREQPVPQRIRRGRARLSVLSGQTA
jgi:hypothetical protein